MKYSFTFKVVMFIGITLGMFSLVSYQEGLPTLTACMLVMSFFFCYCAIAAPDSERYSREYYKKRKGL
jgi:hypothetical protein